MQLIISIWRIRHWKGNRGWGAGERVKTPGCFNKGFHQRGRDLYHTGDTALSFPEDCLHLSGQDTLLDIIYDEPGWLRPLKSVKCPDVAVTIEREEGISCSIGLPLASGLHGKASKCWTTLGWLLKDPVYFVWFSKRERERGESVVYAARVLWGKPWQAGVTLTGLAKRAALHFPHHTICSEWRGYNGIFRQSEREGEAEGKEISVAIRQGGICLKPRFYT